MRAADQHPEPRVRLLGHRPPLDGIRALAFLGVFVGHAALVAGGDPGAVAMFVFFALSGFLITSLLVGERFTTGRVALRRFYGRRALRLLPALYLFLAIWLLVMLMAGGFPWATSVPQGGPGGPEPLHTALHAVWVAACYVMNWAEVLALFHHYMAIGHLWSLAVEEQFYLVWAPLVVALCAWRLRAVTAAALALATGSLLEVFLLYHHGQGELRVYMGTDTRAAAFLLGGALAVTWARGGLRWLEQQAPTLVLAGLAGLGLLWAAGPWSAAGAVLGPTNATSAFLARWVVATFAAPLLVLAAVTRPTGPLARLLSGRLLGYLGSRSYALYLWHYVFLTWFRSLGTPGVVLALVSTLAAAELSWRLVEQRALGLKRRLTSLPDPAPTPSHLAR
ncbi:acyltransferase family protein [Aciditerrimonas ferrireducens]|uniref:Acyltransferase family protein n=1 Tax=Aciditerrimonas ferrireducens TaxID=667306 RepID=A0ABV6C094_9ACTN